ncbi:MAG: N-acetylglucosamine-6-phosphate deacetylase [Actinobacteria bacterium]|nr:N-acetylglucosamine-6-phosphate deacetylase [Actinomycetota bacterium]
MTTPPMLLTGARVVTPEAVLDAGVVLVADGIIVAVLDEERDKVRLGPLAQDVLRSAERVELPGGYLVPGLVDLHVHGAAQAGYADGARAIATAVQAHRRHGTTTTLLSLITATPDRMVAAIRGAVDAASTDPRIRGIHLEGPFLADSRRGAHDPRKLLAPDPAVLDRFLGAGQGLIRMITMAPELPGGLDLVRAMVSHGVHAAVGHSDADYAQAAAAFAAGADIVTHAFNAMRPLHHRDPGVIAAARDAGAVLEAINDGVHLHDATVRLLHAVAPDRLALITDAMAAACAADGHYLLGSLDVDVEGGVARLSEGGSIAGSTLTMDRALRRAVTEVGLDIVDAVNAATRVPARFLGLEREIGAVEPGLAADLVIFDDAWQVRAMLLAGAWADERRP